MRGFGIPFLILLLGCGCCLTPKTPFEKRPDSFVGEWEGQTAKGNPVQFNVIKEKDTYFVTDIDFTISSRKPSRIPKRWPAWKVPIKSGRFKYEERSADKTMTFYGIFTGDRAMTGSFQFKVKRFRHIEKEEFQAVHANP